MRDKRQPSSVNRTFCGTSLRLEWPKGKNCRETGFTEPISKYPLCVPLSPSFSRVMRETEGDFPERRITALTRLPPSLGPQSRRTAHNLALQRPPDRVVLLALASRGSHGKSCHPLFFRTVFLRIARDKQPWLNSCTNLSRCIVTFSHKHSALADLDALCFPVNGAQSKGCTVLLSNCLPVCFWSFDQL